ncbi:MAG TPA: hypothetical protein VGQ27_08445 [Steroidobacteraceae bacterium]|jgi:hypothetical protein|nr:hypothetical protein [Steroidobacteraceae bacterium]
MRKNFLFKSLLAAAVGTLVGSAALAADDTTTISGKMFADLSNYDASNDGVNSPANGFGIDVKRFYLGVTHNFDDIWSVNVTSDFNYVSNDSETQIYIKKAYVQAKLSDAFFGRLGSADLPWVPYAEDLYGYRWVENTLIDRLKFGTSADWGLHAGGKVADGKFSYAAAAINGAGYKNPTRSNTMDFEARLGFMPVSGLSFAVGGYTGKLGKDVENSTTPPQHTANRLDALVAYVQKSFRVGAEYFTADDWNNVTTVASDKADGFSVWGSFNFNDQWSVFARGDSAKTSKDINSNLKDEYFNAGVAAHPRKNVDVALVYKHEKVDGGGFINTSNGNFGGVAAGGKYDEVGIWTQVAF